MKTIYSVWVTAVAMLLGLVWISAKLPSLISVPPLPPRYNYLMTAPERPHNSCTELDGCAWEMAFIHWAPTRLPKDVSSEERAILSGLVIADIGIKPRLTVNGVGRITIRNPGDPGYINSGITTVTLVPGVQETSSTVLNIKPENNRCPVCGHMHEPYRPTVAEIFPSGTCLVDGRTTAAICRQPTEADLPKERLVRCRWCNAAFYQDREK